jgi:hypothetical protein
MRATKVPGILLIFSVLIFAVFLLAVKIDKPFWGHHDWNSVVYSNIARNYKRYGYLGTKFAQVTNYDYQKPENFSFITHYPPILPILISLSFHLFGQSEASARLTIIAFSILLVFFIYKIGKELQSELLGLYAALSLTITPIFLYFGKLPVHDTIVPAVSVVGFWAYLKYFKTENIKYYLLLVVSVIFGGLINWSAYYLIIALLYLQLLTKTSKEVKRHIFSLLPIAALVFIGQVALVYFVKAKSTESVFSNLLSRLDPYLTADLYGFSLLKYLKQELLLVRVYYTLPLFLGAACFVLYFLFKFFKKQKLSFAEIFISSLLIYGIIQLTVFSQLSFIHDYMVYYLSPFMALAFSYITFKILGRFKKSLVFPVILIAIIYFAFLSQLKFTNALIATDTNKRGYMIARLINKETPSGTVSFITSNSYKEFQEVFIGYYSDRNAAYGEQLPKDFDKNYEIVIRPKDHDPLDSESKQMLDDKYMRYEDGNFIWYKLKLKRSVELSSESF